MSPPTSSPAVKREPRGRSLSEVAGFIFERGPEFGFAVVIVSVLIWLCVFMAVPVEPFAFYKDLGYNWEVIDWVAHASRYPIDLIDTLGWATWNSVPLFYENSYLGNLAGILTSILVGNSWLAVKIVEVLQVVVAFAGAFALYRSCSTSLFWSTSFGILYATLPATALMIRGNEDFGWIVALLPGTIALGRSLLQRFGAMALPLVGLLCGLSGFVIALQYLAFASLPIYAIVVLSVRKTLRPMDWITFVPLGLLSCFASGAFFGVPSFENPLVSDSAIRAGTLVNAAFLGTFSQDVQGLLTLVLREWYSSPVPQFNVGSKLYVLFLPGALIWAVATLFVLKARNRGDSFADPSVVWVVVACTVLALGTTLPFGDALWHGLFVIPHFNAIRTVDRFLLVPVLFITFWFVRGLESSRIDRPWAKTSARWAVLLVVVFGISFDLSQHCFTVDPSKGEHEPQLEEVRQIVLSEGGRTTSFASVKDGASEDAAVYGRPAQFEVYADTDIAGKFMTDGLGGVGAFRRMAIRNVIASPSWTYDAPLAPSASNIYRSSRFGHIVFTSPEDVLVSRFPARDVVSPSTILCTYGGPGAFDHLDVAPSLVNASFAEPGTRCSGTGAVDFDPRDLSSGSSPLDAWSGARLVPAAGRLRDRDYTVFLNRTLLNIPWYRNAVDGDSPVFDREGSVLLTGSGSIALPGHPAWRRDSSIQIRAAVHSPATFAVFMGDRVVGTAQASARYGFRWITIRLPIDVPRDAQVRIAYSLADAGASQLNWNGVALDGIEVDREKQNTEAALPGRIAFVGLSLDRDIGGAPPETQRPYIFAPQGETAPISLHEMLPRPFGGTAALIPRSGRAEARYRWDGPPGSYVIRAQTALSRQGSIVSIETGRSRSAVGPEAGGQSSAYLRTDLKRGAVFSIRYISAAFDASLGDHISDVSVLAARHAYFENDSMTGPRATIDFSDPFSAISMLSDAQGVNFSETGARGTMGSSLTASFAIPSDSENVSLSIAKTGEDIVAALACGTSVVHRRLSEDISSMALPFPITRRCTATLRWEGPGTLNRLTTIVAANQKAARTQAAWLPLGTFSREFVAKNGDVARNVDISWTNCPSTAPRCRIPRSGYYTLHVGRDVPRGGTLVLSVPIQATSSRARVEQTAALRWKVAVSQPTGLSLAEPNDGNWVLAGQHGNMIGERCDITQTCFANVAPGQYEIRHRYGRPLVVGLTITGIAVGISTLTLIAAWYRRRKASRYHRPGLRAAMPNPVKPFDGKTSSSSASA